MAVKSRWGKLGDNRFYLLLLGIMVLTAILLAIVLFFPGVVGTSKGPWFWRQG